jgi:acetolactate synthase-1/2/3 large subunit
MSQALALQLVPAPTPVAKPTRVVDVFLRYLKGEGARVVFGIPGGLLHPFFEAIERDSELDLVVTKHEEGAAFMADGYARMSRRLAVCAGTSGPGATNLMTGVACAYADGVPMLVVTGQAAQQALGHGAAQETNREDIDIVDMFRPVTKYSTMVTSAESLAHHLRRALRLALTGRPGPVHLNVPVDLWGKPCDEDWFDPTTYRPDTHTFDRRAVQRAAQLLVEAKRPLILAGSGVGIAEAEEHLITLAELLPAAIVTTPRAKGIVGEDHPLSLGVLGFAGHESARATALGPDVDVLFTVGASLNETTTLNWSPDLRPSRALIQADIDADRIGRNYPVDVPLVGDAQTILVELVYHVHRLIREGNEPQSEWPNTPSGRRLRVRYLDHELRSSDAVPVTPQRWRCDLESVLPDDAVIVSDIGGHMLFNIHHLRIRAGQRFVLNLGFGSMGHGTVAPIGCALADPTRPVVAIVGDACFAMNGMELLTAREYNVPVVWIVENNQMHGITWHGSQMVGERRPLDAVKYRAGVEVAAIARAMGLRAWVVDQPGQIQDVMRQALAAGEPCVIEVRVDPTIAPPLGDRAKSIAGFIKK